MRGEMEKVYCREQETPVGQVILGAMGGKLCLCDWQPPSHKSCIASHRLQSSLHPYPLPSSVGSNGALAGYAGEMEAKRCLLELEEG